MQTFVPYPDFAASAAALDDKRLGKQRVETLQIVKAHLDPDYGWQNHPATRMWKHHTTSLIEYGLAVCNVWRARGFDDTCSDKLIDMWDDAAKVSITPHMDPIWFGDYAVHQSHRAMLWRKAPELYRPFVGTFDQSIDQYVWPV